MVPFDAVNEHAEKIAITGSLFAKTQVRTQYLVVDIDRPLGNAGDQHITRYHIDPNRSKNHSWIKRDVTVDIVDGDYQSVVGRASGKHFGGIYTAGTAGRAPHLIYEPIINQYGDGPVAPRRLQLPGRAIPSAIATARNDDGFNDRYAVGGSTLYLLPADSQEVDIEPISLAASDLFSGTDTLRAMTHDGVTTLWGRNTSDRVYYLACQTDRLEDPEAWSAPMAILSEAERLSPYVNRADGGNTIFGAGNGKLQMVIQGSATTGNIWRANGITLAEAPEVEPTSFKSYTTSLHVMQEDRDLPVPNAVVDLSANTRTPVYINGLYYVLSPNPIQVTSDMTGSLTVVEATDGLHAAILTISLDNTSLTINPTDHTFAKIAALDSAEKLRGAQFPSETVAGGVVESPDYTALLDPSMQNLAALKGAYASVQNSSKKVSAVQASTTKSSTTLCRNQQTTASTAMLRATHPNAANLLSWGNIGYTLGDAANEVGHVLGDVIHTLVWVPTMMMMMYELHKLKRKMAQAVGHRTS